MTTPFPNGLIGTKMELYYNGTWNDHTSDVRGLGSDDGEIEISPRGQPDESSDITTTVTKLSVNNADGKYSPRNVSSTLYGLIGRNTPLRISADVSPIQSVVDHFNVSSASGWPNAESGHVYTHVGAAAAQFIVTGGEALHRHASASTTYTTELNGVYATDFDIYIRGFHLEAELNGGTCTVRFRVRINGGDYIGAELLYTTGSPSNPPVAVGYRITDNFVTVSNSNETITGDPGHATPVSVRLQVEGSNVRVKGWITSSTEPDEWNFETTTTITLPGSIEIESTLSSGVLNAMPFDASIGEIDMGMGIILCTQEVAEWPKRWDSTGNDVWVPIVACGITRRLRQGSRAIRSALYRYLAGLNLLGYWDMENLEGTLSSVPSALSGGAPFILNNDDAKISTVGSGDTDLIGAGAVPVTITTNSNSAAVQSWGKVNLLASSTTHDTWSIVFFYNGVISGDENDVFASNLTFRLRTVNATSFVMVDVSFGAEDVAGVDRYGISVIARDEALTAVMTISTTLSYTPGWKMVRITADRPVTTPRFRVYVEEALITTGTIGTVGGVGQPNRFSSFFMNTGFSRFTGSIAHFAVASGTTTDPLASNGSTILDASRGYDGELATVRFGRLCGEEGIFCIVTEAANETGTECGPQKELNIVELLLETVRADDGVMYELRQYLGYGFKTRESLYLPSTTLTLDYSAYDLGTDIPEVTDDDQRTRNKITGKRLHGGETVTLTKTTGPLSINDPADSPPGAGLYDVDINPSPNLYSASQLTDYVGHRLHLGTWDEDRWPAIKIELHRSRFTQNVQQLVTAVFLEIAEVLSIVNTPSWLGPDSVVLQVRAVSLFLSNFTWALQWTTLPAGPWSSLAVLDSVSLGRLDTDGSSLVVAVDDNDTDLLVLTENPDSPLWTTEPSELRENGIEFRLNPPARAGGLGGEKVRVGGSYDFEDTFTRTASSGWGTSDSGHTTSTSGGSATDYSVSSGTGRLSLGTVNVRREVFYDVNLTDFDIEGQVTCPVTPTGNLIEIGNRTRYVDGSNYLDFRLFLQTTGLITCVIRQFRAGVETFTSFPTIHGALATNTLHYRFRAIGARAFLKVWVNNNSEPEGWRVVFNATHVASGDISAFASLNTGNTNTLPVVIQWDNLIGLTPKITHSYYDYFNRTVSNGMGSANVGGAWTTQFTGAGGSVNDFDVAPCAVTTVMPDANAAHWAYLDDIDLLDVCLSEIWSLTVTPTGAAIQGGPILRGTASNTYIHCRVSISTASAVTAEIVDVNAGVESSLASVALGWLTHSTSVPLCIKAYASGSEIGMRVWTPTTNNEPKYWHLTATDPVPASGWVGFSNRRASGNTNVNPTPSTSDFYVHNPQRLTVTRGVNNAARTWAVDTDVRLWSPMILGR